MKHKYQLRNLILLSLSLIWSLALSGQCTNTTQFPADPVVASTFNNTITITSEQKAGQYFEITGLTSKKNFVFASSSIGDYITVRDANSGALLGHGSSPHSYYVGTGPDYVQVHINTSSPACGSEATFRTTYAVCTDCTPIPPGTGVGTTDPEAKLDIAGEIKIGDLGRPPLAGMIRWNTSTEDFEGYNGTHWISLTSKAGWGIDPFNTVQENNKITAGDGLAGDYFGSSVSISADHAIVGASNDDVGGNSNQGSAYIFLKAGIIWSQESKLTSSDGKANDNFGVSVSISGDYAIVGAPGDDISTNFKQGSAYIYYRTGSTWTQQAKLTASDGKALDEFGHSVAISGDYAIVGSRYHDVGINNSQGAAYVFVRTGSTWTQEQKLTSSDGQADDIFGTSVNISGDYVIVGAPGDDVDIYNDQGSAYIFHWTGAIWTQQAKITASDGLPDDTFGYSVSISGDYAIVGKRFDNVGENFDQGSAYVFHQTGITWTQEAKLTAADGASLDSFGWSVSISEDIAIIGALNDKVGANTSQGSAYVFERTNTNWVLQVKITSTDGDENDFFGGSVCISIDHAIIGAYADVVGFNTGQGSAYIVKKN